MDYSKQKFERLFKDNYPHMYRMAFSMVENADDAKDAVLFLASGNKLVNPTVVNDDENASSYIKGFRAYFQLKGEAVGARAFSLDLGDGETTGVTDVRSKMADVRGDYFDLQGRKVENTAKKGIYIQNGRKVVIK